MRLMAPADGGAGARGTCSDAPLMWGPLVLCSVSDRRPPRPRRRPDGISANYYDGYPGNNPENHSPAESCTIHSKLKNSNI